MHERPTEPLRVPELTDEQREQLLRNVAEVHAAINAFVQAVIPQVQAAARAFAQISAQLQRAGLLDADGKPTARPDRPAWQTPYGPPTRRR
ncbi:hypothetical protein ABTZ58_03795 [Streptomyces sp. NPDC094143]|uniref:hypothetical protein n=1 Tax=unclassified Streptomyces TaxID=2593676 RepID=UPI003329096B